MLTITELNRQLSDDAKELLAIRVADFHEAKRLSNILNAMGCTWNNGDSFDVSRDEGNASFRNMLSRGDLVYTPCRMDSRTASSKNNTRYVSLEYFIELINTEDLTMFEQFNKSAAYPQLNKMQYHTIVQVKQMIEQSSCIDINDSLKEDIVNMAINSIRSDKRSAFQSRHLVLDFVRGILRQLEYNQDVANVKRILTHLGSRDTIKNVCNIMNNLVLVHIERVADDNTVSSRFYCLDYQTGDWYSQNAETLEQALLATIITRQCNEPYLASGIVTTVLQATGLVDFK